MCAPFIVIEKTLQLKIYMYFPKNAMLEEFSLWYLISILIILIKN